MKLTFKPVDVQNHADVAIEMRRDSFECSFDTPDHYIRDCGEDGSKYIKWLVARMETLPGSCVHAWLGDQIVGQVDMGVYRLDPKCGYVNLYCLKPAFRGTGLGTELDQYVTTYLAGRGHKEARLSVSPTNARAVRFYTKCGWVSLGPHPDRPTILMGKNLSVH